MDVTPGAVAIWLASTLAMQACLVLFGMIKMRSDRNERRHWQEGHGYWAVEVLVPVKGSFPGHESALASLLEQDHPNYQVVFVVESEDDPAFPLLTRLCARYSHARKVISGSSTSCAQKNHSLVAGVNSLRRETRIIVTADSTNVANPGWLKRLVAPIEESRREVVTTFRAFAPVPQTVGGVCQAIYASYLLLLQLFRPTPWGGATAIRRDTFERLGVATAWAHTIVDDLVLGNLVHRAGISVLSEPHNRLKSPVTNQTVSGFLSYLDRQVLFPRFTNPGVWIGMLIYHLNTTAAVLAILAIGIVLYPLGVAGRFLGWVALGSLAGTMVLAGLLRSLNPFSISLRRWLVSFYPCVFLTAFICVRSLFRSYVTWHGRKYWAGSGGVVHRVDVLSERG